VAGQVLRPGLALLTLAAALGLPACAQAPQTPAMRTGQTEHPDTPRNGCHLRGVTPITGRQATPELLETARRQAGARLLRVVGHDEMVTQEYNASRLTVLLDAQGRVAMVSCG